MPGFAVAAHPARRPQTAARWASVTVGVMCSIVGWLAVGTNGAAAAAIGTLIVVGFLWSGTIPVVLTDGARLGAGAGLALLLLTYTLRLAIVVLVLKLLSRADLIDRRSVGVTIIACALTWTAVHVGAAVRRGSTTAAADSMPPT